MKPGKSAKGLQTLSKQFLISSRQNYGSPVCARPVLGGPQNQKAKLGDHAGSNTKTHLKMADFSTSAGSWDLACIKRDSLHSSHQCCIRGLVHGSKWRVQSFCRDEPFVTTQHLVLSPTIVASKYSLLPLALGMRLILGKFSIRLLIVY